MPISSRGVAMSDYVSYSDQTHSGSSVIVVKKEGKRLRYVSDDR